MDQGFLFVLNVDNVVFEIGSLKVMRRESAILHDVLMQGHKNRTRTKRQMRSIEKFTNHPFVSMVMERYA